jgi:hypothetical protein
MLQYSSQLPIPIAVMIEIMTAILRIFLLLFSHLSWRVCFSNLSPFWDICPNLPNINIAIHNINLDIANINMDIPKINLDIPKNELDIPNIDMDILKINMDIPNIYIDIAEINMFFGESGAKSLEQGVDTPCFMQGATQRTMQGATAPCS